MVCVYLTPGEKQVLGIYDFTRGERRYTYNRLGFRPKYL